MELWIRSQENYEVDITPRLIKVNDIFLDYCGENDSFYISVNNGIEIAYYNSEKRALEVLTEIQNILNPMIVFKNCNCTKDMLDKIKEVGACVVSDNSHIEQLSTCVYEMPNE